MSDRLVQPESASRHADGQGAEDRTDSTSTEAARVPMGAEPQAQSPVAQSGTRPAESRPAAGQADAEPAARRRFPWNCLLYTSPSPRDRQKSRMPSSA